VTISNPPNAPTIDGPTTGKRGIEYKYTFVTIDPDGDDVRYYIDWLSTGGYWWGSYASGEEVVIPHYWPG
jgi:hypothetical protein